jgi:hypothetical protein
MEEKILARHPEKGKQGVRISKAKYEQMRAALVKILRERGEITFTELAEAANQQLRGQFDGSISWYVTTVKLDLEARKIIKRVPKTQPPLLRLVKD